MATMNASILIEFLTKGAAKTRSQLDQMRRSAQGFKKTVGSKLRHQLGTEKLDAALMKAEQKMQRARQGMLASAGVVAGAVMLIKNLGNVEARLTNFGNISDLSSEKLGAIAKKLHEIAPIVNQTSGELLTALEYMVGKGLSVDAGLAALEAVGRTATATKGNIEDLAASGFASLDNLKMPADNLQLAFDAMAVAGKAGGFELKDMAAHFPALTASARMLKMQGVRAVAELSAALQIAMKGASDPSTAANNLQNFLSKITSPETIRNFKKNFNVNIEDELKIAAKNGVSIFEHMLKLIQEKTKGDPIKLGQMFGDMQVLNFLKPMLAGFEEYEKIRDAALAGDGTVLKDFNNTMKDLNEILKSTLIEFDNLRKNNGPLLTTVKEIARTFRNAMREINKFAEAHPDLTAAIIKTVAALTTLFVATTLGRFALAAIRLPALKILNIFSRFDKAGRNVSILGRALRGLKGVKTKSLHSVASASSAMTRAFAPNRIKAMLAGFLMLNALGKGASGGLLIRLFRMLHIAAVAALTTITSLSWPLVAIFATIGSALFSIWKYWQHISNYTKGFGKGLSQAFEPEIKRIKKLWSDMTTYFYQKAKNARDAIGNMAESMGFDGEAVKDWLDKAFDTSIWQKKFNEIKQSASSFFKDLFTQETLSEDEAAAIEKSGEELGQRLGNGIKKIWNRIDSFIQEKIETLKTLFSFDIKLNWPEMPGWITDAFERFSNSGKSIPSTAPQQAPSMPALSGAAAIQSLGGTYDAFIKSTRDASNHLEAGARNAGETLGQAAERKIKASAEEMGRIMGRAAASEINRARVQVNIPSLSNSMRGGLSDRKKSALHDGVD